MNRFLLAGILALGAGCSGKAEPPAAATNAPKDFIKIEPGNPRLDFIKVEAVQETDAAIAVTLPGKISFDEDHTQRLASPIDGRVTAVPVRLGDKVKPGQSLIELSSPSVGQLQADAQKALQDMAVQQKAVDRVHKLQTDGAISDKEVAQAEADFKKAKSDVARTTAQLHSLGVSASDPAVSVTLRSQLSGVLVERNVLVGQEIRADQAAPLLTIASLDNMWIQADAYEQDLSLLEEGVGVTVHVPAYPGESFPGVVKHIGDVVDKDTRTVKVRCVVANADHRLKAEMFAKVDLKNRAGIKVLMIPTSAIITEGESTKVIVQGEGNVFRLRDIDIGPELEGKVRVLGRLHAGERVVTEGAIFLKREI